MSHGIGEEAEFGQNCDWMLCTCNAPVLLHTSIYCNQAFVKRKLWSEDAFPLIATSYLCLHCSEDYVRFNCKPLVPSFIPNLVQFQGFSVGEGADHRGTDDVNKRFCKNFAKTSRWAKRCPTSGGFLNF